MRPIAFVIPGDITLPTGGYAYDRRVLAEWQRAGVTASHVALPGSFPQPKAGDLAETLRIMADTPRDCVLLIDGLAYGAMPREVIAAFDRAIVALVHHPLCLEAGLNAARQRNLRASETAALALAQHVVVTSPMTARTLLAEFAVPQQRITIAEPGTDPAARTHVFAEIGQERLLAVGSIVPRKGYLVLIEALRAFAGKPDWRLTIAAAKRDAGEVGRVEAAIAAASLSANITLAGAVSDHGLNALYKAATIFVMPSLFEGYGMVLAEAMARGLPIVCTTGGAAAETVPDAAAIKVEPGNVRAFADALAQVMHDRRLKDRLADASWAAGQQLPRWPDTARKIAAAIKGLSA